jgi:hypothetical protein
LDPHESDRAIHSMNKPDKPSLTSDPDMRQAWTLSTGAAQLPVPTPSSRPQSIRSREKSLPPLPSDAERKSRPPVPQQVPRPQTAFTYDRRDVPSGINGALQDDAARRQSFSGTSARPNGRPIQIQGDGGYDEFGNALGYPPSPYLPPAQSLPSIPVPVKRRSKLASLLGKRISRSPESTLPYHQEYGTARSLTRDGEDVLSNGGYATSASRHSALSAAPRMSVTSRRAIDELVAQDPDFIAYRYPSTDQGLELQW